MKMTPPQTLLPLLVLVGVLTLANAALLRFPQAFSDPDSWILAQITVDLIVLTGLLHFSGGLENPLHTIFLFHVIIAGVALSKSQTYSVSLVVAACFTLLGLSEMFGWVEHYTIDIFPHHDVPHEAEHASHDPVFVVSRIVTFLAMLGLTAYFTTLIVAELRRREGQLVIAAQDALGERRKLLAAVDAAGAGMVLLDSEGTVQWFSARMVQWFGLSAQDLGKACSTTPWAAYTLYGEGGEMSSKPERWRKETERELVMDDGNKMIFLLTSSALYKQEEGLVEVVELVQDITQRKTVEAELAHSSKMADLGRLSAGIAHEIGNPLSSLSTRLQLLRERQDPNFVTSSIDLIQSQLERITRIVRGISGFSRHGSGEWQMVDIGACLQETVNMLRLDRRAVGIDIQVDCQERLSRTTAVEDELKQVFLNIGINALEAMPDGGRLILSAGSDNEEISVSFQDTGQGISDEVRRKVFAPFFTTKPQGTGLGLSLSYEIVKAHGGRLSVDSTPGKGSTVAIHLPIRHRLEPPVQ
jgi:PAS domain S-box-containing protein